MLTYMAIFLVRADNKYDARHNLTNIGYNVSDIITNWTRHHESFHHAERSASSFILLPEVFPHRTIRVKC